jgi:LruC domain-containing protein
MDETLNDKAMKTNIKLFLLTASLALVLNACMKDQYNQVQTDSQNNKPLSYAGFEFKTVQEYDVEIQVLNSQNLPFDGVSLELYTTGPTDGAGRLLPGIKSLWAFKGTTDAQGILKCKINPAIYADSLFILSNQIGLPNLSAVPLDKNLITIQIGGASASKSASATGNGLKSAPVTIPKPTLVNGYYTLGTWDKSGVPNYLVKPNDEITNSLLKDMTSSLPEYISLLKTHPQYLASTNDVNLDLIKNAEVWVTFVHEGAGWMNSLGYYTYPTGKPPTKKEDIRDLTVIFPNVSFSGSGGGLNSGNKVQLFYLDPITKAYTNVFPTGVTVGWFLIAQGWNSSAATISKGAYTDYSDVQCNLESSSDLRKHNVLLFDKDRNILLLGFEDMRRDQGSDQDFNDAVFYATVSPHSAVDNSTYQLMDKPVDTDGDGVTDALDQYPTDPLKAYNNYYPSQTQFGSFVFEDLWPYKGDYDFNDLVVDYNFNQVTNAKNQVVAVHSKIVVRAIGASYHNAFGISLNTTPDNVASVSGQRNTKNYLTIKANGIEANQVKATIIYFDDAYSVLPYPGSGVFINTYHGTPFVTPDTIKVDISFVNPVEFANIGTPPYNPFIIINQERGVEVHLPNLPPTSLADLKLLGTGQDNSNVSASKYYVSDTYLPWAINLPVSFDYPAEKQDITNAYLKFNSWAGSNGANYKDWYLNKSGYRNNTLIYNK